MTSKPTVAPKAPKDDLVSSILNCDDLTVPEDIHTATARVAHLAKLTHYALSGMIAENREAGYEGVVYSDAEMISSLLTYLWLASSATHRLCAGDKAVV